MSIRLRLTLLYSAILALTLIAFSITLYLTQARTTLNASKKELAERAKQWTPPEPRFKTGCLARYAAAVACADTGAVIK